MMICGMRFDSLMASGCRFRALMRTLRALQFEIACPKSQTFCSPETEHVAHNGMDIDPRRPCFQQMLDPCCPQATSKRGRLAELLRAAA